MLKTIWLGLILLPLTVHASPGFYPLTDPMIPAAVREAAQSVFLMAAPSSESGKPEKVVNTNTKRNPKGWWEQAQLEFCKAHQLIFCALFPNEEVSSAFLAGDQSTVFTVLHSLNSLITAQAKAQHLTTPEQILTALNQIPWPIGFENFSGLKIFGSSTNSAHLGFFNSDPNLYSDKFGQRTLLFRFSDLVKLQIQNPLANVPLTFASVRPQVGDPVYILGYPRKTVDRKILFEAADAPGEALRISKGRVLDVQTFSRKSGVPFDQDALTSDTYMIFTDADVEHGDSGGPIVNAQGEVVGIVSGEFPDLSLTPSPNLSSGLRALSEETLNALWVKFKGPTSP